jgi:dienelactone hydrolase
MNQELLIKLFKNIFVLTLFMSLAACARYTFSGQRPEPVTELSQGQTGRIYFESTNPANYKSIMTRRWLDTRKTLIWGTLTIPPKSRGKVSAVIILRNIENKHSFVWARELNEIGLATFVVEVEASRKSHRYDDQRREIHSPTYVADAFAALNLLSTHPAIDADNVAVMGYSKGGHAASIAASTKIHRLLAKPGLKFAAHVGIYPGCHFTLHDIKMTGAPLLFLMGGKDNKNIPELCERYAARIRKAGFESKVNGVRHN